VGAGRRVEAWTLEWDEDTQSLKKMRSKETEADYRYFREPDLLSVPVSEAWKNEILQRLPELPLDRRARFMAQYGLSEYDATLLTDERSLSDYFEAAVRLAADAPDGRPPAAKTVANWVQNEILRLLNDRGLTAADLAFSPAHLAQLIALVEAGTITRQTAVGLIPKVIETGQSPGALVAAQGLAQISGGDALRTLAQAVIAENPEQVAAYRAKPTLLKWFVGQVMRKSQGKANAQAAEKILVELLTQDA
jgi:aspartyl-tRNA(Asn)/glutamyl-tRNA(Gln) amidotransferase subunit B